MQQVLVKKLLREILCLLCPFSGHNTSVCHWNIALFSLSFSLIEMLLVFLQR